MKSLVLGRRFLKSQAFPFNATAQVAVTPHDFTGVPQGSAIFELAQIAVGAPSFVGVKGGRAAFDLATLSLTAPDFIGSAASLAAFDLATVAITVQPFAGLKAGLAAFEASAIALTAPDFAGLKAGLAAFDLASVSLTAPDFTASTSSTGAFDLATVALGSPDFTGLKAGLAAFEASAIALTAPDFAGLKAGLAAFDLATVSLAAPDFTAAASVATISISAIGPQEASGNVPVTYSIDVDDSTVEAVLFLAASADPAAADFNTGATTGYIDLGQVSLTTAGSGINLTGPAGLAGSYKLALLPTGGGDVDVAVSPAFTLDSTSPTLSAATGTQTGGTTATWGVTSDEAGGTIYAGVRPAASAALTAAQLIAGSGGAGVAWDSDATPTADSANGGSFTGLTSETDYQVDVVQVDAFGNESSVVSSSTFTTADVTAPTLSAPAASANGSSGATSISVSTNEGTGTLYWGIYPTASTPSAADVVAGTGATVNGSQAVSASGTQNVADQTGLTASTAYKVHFVHDDASSNRSAVATSAEFTTAAADVTAPTLTSPTDAANGSTASTGSVSTDEGNGTLYWVVTTSATAPTAAQVKLGQDNSGVAAAASGSQSVSGTGVQTLSPAPSGLTASTAYTTHFMHEDAATNQSAVSSASGFTTAAGSTGIVDSLTYGETSGTIGDTFSIDVSALDIQAGDCILVTMQCDGPHYTNGPSGFTAAFTPNSLNSAGEGFWYLNSASGSESTLTLDTPSAGTGTADNCAVTVTIVRGYTYDSYASGIGTGSTFDTPQLAGFLTGDISFQVVICDDDLAAFTPPSGWTKIDEIQNGVAETGGTTATAYKDVTADGTEVPGDWSTSAADRHVLLHVRLAA